MKAAIPVAAIASGNGQIANEKAIRERAYAIWEEEGRVGAAQRPAMIDDRDYVGCGADPPDPQWPGGARVAVNIKACGHDIGPGLTIRLSG
jgi:hypothetical protein